MHRRAHPPGRSGPHRRLQTTTRKGKPLTERGVASASARHAPDGAADARLTSGPECCTTLWPNRRPSQSDIFHQHPSARRTLAPPPPPPCNLPTNVVMVPPQGGGGIAPQNCTIVSQCNSASAPCKISLWCLQPLVFSMLFGPSDRPAPGGGGFAGGGLQGGETVPHNQPGQGRPGYRQQGGLVRSKVPPPLCISYAKVPI